MGRLLFLLSFMISLLAVLLYLDSFSSVRARFGEFLPTSVSIFLNQIRNIAASFFVFIIPSEQLFTKNELLKYKGEDGGKVYLAILGSVYDVTRGKRHYGPGGGYSFFSGRDGSRAFVSGDFTEKGLTDDLAGFTNEEALSLEEWREFYQKDYTYLGRLVGRFYTKEGKPTRALAQYQEKLRLARAEKRADADLKLIFPPCNSQWSQGGGTHVWCTTRSGGVQRDWVGVPRLYFQPGRVQDEPRCACVRTTGPPSGSGDKVTHNNRGDLDNPNLKMYDGCDLDSDFCIFTRTGA